MPGPLSDEEVNRRFEVHGYKLLSIYKHSRSPVRIRCPQGHILNVWPCGFFAGIRCATCKKNRPVTHAMFRDMVEKAGYLIHSGLVRNESNFVTLTCPQGHKFISSWKKFRIGYRCKYCHRNYYDTDRIRVITKSRGIRLISESYLGYKVKHEFECPYGHRYHQTWEKFLEGKGCKFRGCYKYPKSGTVVEEFPEPPTVW